MIVFGDKCFSFVSFLITVCAAQYIVIGTDKIKTAAKYRGYESVAVIKAQIWQIAIDIMYLAAPFAKALISNLSSFNIRDFTIRQQNLSQYLR